VLAAVRRGHGEGRGEHLQWWAPLVSVSFAMQQSASGPMDSQQTDSKGKEDSRGETEGRERQEGILSLLSRRLILSCSSLTSLPRLSAVIEPPKTANAFSGSFAVSPNLGHELSPIIGWQDCYGGLWCSCFLVSVRLFLHTQWEDSLLSVQSSYGLFVSLCHFRDNSWCVTFHFPYFFN
jgi:hypothetical protein